MSGKLKRFKQYREKNPTETQTNPVFHLKSCNKIIKQITTWKISAEKQGGEISDWNSLQFFLLPILPLYPAVCDEMGTGTQSIIPALCPSAGWGKITWDSISCQNTWHWESAVTWAGIQLRKFLQINIKLQHATNKSKEQHYSIVLLKERIKRAELIFDYIQLATSLNHTCKGTDSYIYCGAPDPDPQKSQNSVRDNLKAAGYKNSKAASHFHDKFRC